MLEQHSIEIFHLLFLRQLGDKIPKDRYALKGGCNLRFYLKSIRYSEDIDFDVKTIAKDTLKSNVRKIIQSPSFIKTLASKDITIADSSEPKQTETTQRWKIKLRVAGREIPIHTKIEFSRRNLDPGTAFEAIDPGLVHGYGLYPIYSNHYGKDSALRQKINALIHRSETQARDVFDLSLLIDAGATPPRNSRIDLASMEKAQNNALSMSYADFKGQVQAYLLPEFQSRYAKESWNRMVEKIVNFLEKMK